MKKTMTKNQIQIPFYDFGGKGKSIHFAHANGYPPEGYRQFIQPFLKNHQVIASKYRPLWGNENHNQLKTWNTLADDMIQFMDSQGLKNVIGMGHSMGGTISVVAALKRPDLFEKLILIDPVIFSRKFLLPTLFLPFFLLKKIIPIAKVSNKRRNKWSSKEEVYELWRKKRVFKRFSDESLKDLVNAAITSDGNGGMTLAFSREWETQVYMTAPYVFSKMMKLEIPITVVKAEFTNVITKDLWSTWQTKQPQTEFIEFKDAGHLVPLESPKELANMLLKNL